MEKLAFLRRLDAHTLDLSMSPAERRRFPAQVWPPLGRAGSSPAREEQRRYPILLTPLAQSTVDVLDELLLLFRQAISARESAARRSSPKPGRSRPAAEEDRQALLDEILAIVLDPAIGYEMVGRLLREGRRTGPAGRGSGRPGRERLPATTVT